MLALQENERSLILNTFTEQTAVLALKFCNSFSFLWAVNSDEQLVQTIKIFDHLFSEHFTMGLFELETI